MPNIIRFVFENDNKIEVSYILIENKLNQDLKKEILESLGLPLHYNFFLNNKDVFGKILTNTILFYVEKEDVFVAENVEGAEQILDKINFKRWKKKRKRDKESETPNKKLKTK